MSDSDITLSRNVLETVAIAGEYCSFLENCGSFSKADFYHSLNGLVPLLYLRGLLLPAIEPEYPEANERYVTEEQWDGLFTSLRDFLENEDEFSYISQNEYGQEAQLIGSIAEHLTDVYQDMKDFVLLFKKPALAARENAVHQCKIHYTEHWGARLANLLPVLHAHRSSEDNTDLLGDFQDFL